jgi:carboxylate-amine ligase
MDEGMVYFDARASRQWPTVELRVCDVCLDVDHAVVLAGLGRALVETAAREWRAGVPPQPVRVEVLRGAAWRAARSGISGTLVDPVTATAVAAPEQVQRLLDHVTPALADYGDLGRVGDGLERILTDGTGADAQRRFLDEQGTLAGVVRGAVHRTVA